MSYYIDFFAGEEVDFLIVNDGPVSADFDPGPADLITFPERLGRSSLMCMPGFKRSFYAAVRAAVRRDYHRIAHIESDCWLLPSGRADFLQALDRPGHFVPWLTVCSHCESALQILNDPQALLYFLHNYEDGAFEEEEHFERSIDELLKPSHFLSGERWSLTLNFANFKPDHQFYANMPYILFRWLEAILKRTNGQISSTPDANLEAYAQTQLG